MSKVQIEVSENAKGWIDRFQCKSDLDLEISSIRDLMFHVLDMWFDDTISDEKAKGMLNTLYNAETIIEALGE